MSQGSENKAVFKLPDEIILVLEWFSRQCIAFFILLLDANKIQVSKETFFLTKEFTLLRNIFQSYSKN